jgi:L-rhamnose-H+ transport protein
MNSNPFLGVLLHAIGGLAAASFYLPYKRVRKWSWETYWLTGGFFSWIIAPSIFLLVIAPGAFRIIAEAPTASVLWTYFFGVLWGIGGLTFGLSMRYLGIALGYAIALGFCAAFGTLIPPLYRGEIGRIAATSSGQLVLLGVSACLVGITLSGAAGITKERGLSDEQKKLAVHEFSLWKGLGIAVFCGILCASISYGFAAGKPLAALALQKRVPPLWQNLPVLVLVLLGGFTTNAIWCVLLNFRNGTWREYFNGMPDTGPTRRSEPKLLRANDKPGQGMAPGTANTPSTGQTGVALAANYLFCGLAGTTWYLQFFFYGMGTTKMGRYDFSSWTLHMASIIVFSTVWGVLLREWQGTRRRTHALITLGLLTLIASTVVIGLGNYLASQ